MKGIYLITISLVVVCVRSMDEGETKQFCYSCSSKSALCRHSVYDGQYLTVAPCRTSCFLRIEGEDVYRGCFDGWVGGLVKNNYEGCQVQKYLGEEVEWCFCIGDTNRDKAPCNGASRDTLNKISYGSSYSHYVPRESIYPNRQSGENLNPQSHYSESTEYDYDDSKDEFQDNYKYGTSESDYQYDNHVDDRYLEPRQGESLTEGYKTTHDEDYDNADYYYDDNKVTLSEPTYKRKPDAKEGSHTDSAVVNDVVHELAAPVIHKPAELYNNVQDTEIDCYSCHDHSEHCRHHVTKPEFLTLSKCKSKCFIRREFDKLYRGCFDGWMTSRVAHNYNGCRMQNVLGSPVEWCFCDTPLCNGASIPEISNLKLGPYTSDGYSKAVYQRAYSDEYANSVTGGHRLPSKQPYTRIEGKEGNDLHGYDFVDTPNTSFRSGPIRARSVVGMCRGMRDGIYADPFDCARFVHCFNGFTYRRLCAPGTVWNPEKNYCDYSYRLSFDCMPPRITSTPDYRLDETNYNNQNEVNIY